MMNNKRGKVEEALNNQPTDQQYAKAYANIAFYALIIIGIFATWFCTSDIKQVFWLNIAMISGAILTVVLAEYVKNTVYLKYLTHKEAASETSK